MVLSHHQDPSGTRTLLGYEKPPTFLLAQAVVRAVRHSLVPVTTALSLAESHLRLTQHLVGRALCGEAASLRLDGGAREVLLKIGSVRGVVVAARTAGVYLCRLPARWGRAQRCCAGFFPLATVEMAGSWWTCFGRSRGERARVSSPAVATASAEVSTAADDGKPRTRMRSNHGVHESVGSSLPSLPAIPFSSEAVGASRGDSTEGGLPLVAGGGTEHLSSPDGGRAPGSTGGQHLPSPVTVYRAAGSGNAFRTSDATAASPQGLSRRDDDTHGGYDATDKITCVASWEHTDGRDQVPGRGYSLTTFRVVSCVHPNREVVPGSKVYACLGRNVYVLWGSSRRGVPTTVDAFRAAGPSCIVLERGAGALRAASEEEGAAVGGLHTNRLLFLNGKERNSISSGQDLLDVQLLLEAPSAAICTSWVTGGGSLLTPWEALVCASLSGWNDATAVHELLMSVLPPLPETADDQLGIASRVLGRRGRHFVLNAQHWLAPSASVGLTGASAIGKAADAADQVTGVPVVGPVLRLSLLVVQVGALAVLADGHAARRKDAVERCEAIAFDVLCRIFEQLRTDPTEFGSACATASQWSRRGLAVVVPRPFNLNIDLPA